MTFCLTSSELYAQIRPCFEPNSLSLFNFSRTWSGLKGMMRCDAKWLSTRAGKRFTNLKSLCLPMLRTKLSPWGTSFNHKKKTFSFFYQFYFFFLSTEPLAALLQSAQVPAKESTKHFQTKSMRLICDLYGESEEWRRFTHVCDVHVKWRICLMLLIFFFSFSFAFSL